MTSDDDFPADAYKKIVLLAKAKPYEFVKQVTDYLTRNAGWVSRNTYHLGHCSVQFRMDAPQALEDKSKINVALDLTARTKSDLEETAKMILSQKQLKGFRKRRNSPDPLLQAAMPHLRQ